MGAGKGRYVKRLLVDQPDNRYSAMDISARVMRSIDDSVDRRLGRLTCTPYADAAFDMVYVCEALEHAIHIDGAIRELYRIVKPGGRVVIIDKPIEKLGALRLDEWERWIDDADMQRLADELGAELEIAVSIPYEGRADGLFRGWVLKK